MKETEKINYQVLEPLLNQILFGKPDKPIFDNGKTDMCKDFLQTRSNYEKDSWIIEKYIGKQTEIILNNFSKDDRFSTFQIIIADPLYIDTIIFQAKINNGDISISNFENIREEIIKQLSIYIQDDNVNYYIKRFFALYFEELFYFEYVYDNHITEEEYFEIYSRNTNPKTLV